MERFVLEMAAALGAAHQVRATLGVLRGPVGGHLGRLDNLGVSKREVLVLVLAWLIGHRSYLSDGAGGAAGLGCESGAAGVGSAGTLSCMPAPVASGFRPGGDE